MKQRALIVGINYTGTSYQLKGCINDANNVKALLEGKGFTSIELLLEKDATTAGILAALQRLTADAEPGDVLVFHYSGHGSQIYSKLEEDMLDEIICPIDLDWRDNVITDNELKTIFNKVPNGVNTTVILDCCHSGTGLDQSESAVMSTKDLGGPDVKKAKVTKKSIKHRYLAPPSEILENISENFLELREWNTSRDVNASALLIAGCHPNETSADATINGKPQGAATAAMISVLKANPEATYQEVFEGMTKYMIVNGFTQRPQLDGSRKLYDRKFLESWADVGEVPEEIPTLTDEVIPVAHTPPTFGEYLTIIGVGALLVALIMVIFG